ncbi:MAG: hypothetical protein ACXVCP_15005 [Bdellovibrio sp.]
MSNLIFKMALVTVISISTLAHAEILKVSGDTNSGVEKFQKNISVMYRKDVYANQSLRRSNTLMSYHNGSVLKTSSTALIFWGAPWSDPTFANDKITGLDSFFSGFSGSNYAKTSNEYYDTTSYITSFSNYLGYNVDTSTPPGSNPSTSTIINEVCKMTNNNPDPNAIYFVYTSSTAGKVNYCAWHSWGTCSNGAKVQAAYMPNIDGIAGCDPQDTTTTHSQGLAALANVTAHELLEAITDPRGAGWYDSQGAENGDKCAWAFPNTTGGLSNFPNGTSWKLQMEWSNAASTAGTGLPNLNGQKGCIF